MLLNCGAGEDSRESLGLQGLGGSQAPRRAVCGTRGSLRTMHGGCSAPSCCAFPHRFAFEEGPSEWTGWISLQSKGLSRVFSSTTVQKHQFFGAQPFLLSRTSLVAQMVKNLPAMQETRVAVWRMLLRTIVFSPGARLLSSRYSLVLARLWPGSRGSYCTALVVLWETGKQPSLIPALQP